MKIVGGFEYGANQHRNPYEPSCDQIANSGIEWHNELVATDRTSGGSSSFQSVYRVCFYDALGKLLAQPLVCNSEVGD